MKALILLLVVLAGVWLWRNGRKKELTARKRPDERATAAPERLQEMVCCPVCGVHLPRSDAVAGHTGLYCSDAHRRQAEP